MVFTKVLGKTCGFLGYVLQYACITHCTFEYIGDFVMVGLKVKLFLFFTKFNDILYFQCSGPSMEPTLESNNILLTEHITPRFQKLQKGDIVIAISPTNPRQNICKRIKGMPGDKVSGYLFKKSQVVPLGHVWLEGDNSSNSADSRVYGPVPQALIRSRVLCRVWPLDRISSLTN